jgi:hypothetical protein
MKEQVFNLGKYVECDGCGKVYRTEGGEVLDEAIGGIGFQSKAICPICAPAWLKDAREFGEEGLVRAPIKEMRFVDFVDVLRGGKDASITLTQFP